MSGNDGHRSLADQLRSWPDERLARLLVLRPDLATPAPHDSGQLASRAATRASLVRALDQLTRLELTVLDALVVAHQTTESELVHLVHAEPAATAAALERLRDLALAWESESGLRAVTGVGDLLTGGPEAGSSGLHPRSSPPHPDPAGALDRLSEPARAMLAHVDAHGGQATTGTARLTVTPAEASSPAEELIAHRLLVPRSGVLVVPGEVGLALRGGRTTRERVDDVPPVPTSERSARLVDRTAAGSAFEAVRHVELLLEGWGTEPPGVLRSGGLGVRDLRATAARLQVDEPTAALLVETAYAAGLVGTTADADGNPAWVPTDAFDRWRDSPVAARWHALAAAWLRSPRMPALVGSKDASGRTWNALVPDLAGVFMAESRRMTLEALRDLPPGQVLAAGTGSPGLVARLAWLRPRRPRTRADQVAWTLTEAAALGVTGLGGLASYAAALLDPADGEGDPEPALAALLPEQVDHVLLQADLTAVAPGPLEPTLARALQEVAEVESGGGATVYRFTPASVRRALSAGRTPGELHALLTDVSRTPVPQPLTYLIDDAARTFGTLRVGHAGSFVRSDDEAALAELLHHPRAEALELRLLAPTVLVSALPIDVLLPRLRDLGTAPVVEAADGTVHVARPEPLRARTPREQGGALDQAREQARGIARASAVVATVRAGDRAAASRPGRGPLTPSDSLAVLREAIDTGRPVVIEYVDQRGAPADRLVRPLTVDGGRLTAHDPADPDDVRDLPLHRITTVRPA